jgi:hypothetical protein
MRQHGEKVSMYVETKGEWLRRALEEYARARVELGYEPQVDDLWALQPDEKLYAILSHFRPERVHQVAVGVFARVAQSHFPRASPVLRRQRKQ